MNRRFFVYVLMLAFPATVYGQGKKDRLLQFGNSKWISGEVTQVTPDSVSIDGQQISVGDVEQLRFRDEPSGLDAVRKDYQNGALEQALRGIKGVKSEGRDFVQQEVAFYQVAIPAKLALRGAADVKAAARDMGAFLKQHSSSFCYYDACEIMGDLAMSLGRAEVAGVYYGKLADATSPTIADRGSLLLGDALQMSGELERARERYARCARSENARIQAMGQVSAAACNVTENPRGAIAQIEKVIAENDSEDIELFARAYNALGSAFQAAGNHEAALDAYLHTDLLFYRDAEKHAEALYHLANLWAEVNKPSEATKARAVLKQRYKSSIWAQR